MKRTYNNQDRLTKDETLIIRDTFKCPDCGSKLHEGPCGGLSINILCGNCGAKFNIGLIGIDRITNNFKWVKPKEKGDPAKNQNHGNKT